MKSMKAMLTCKSLGLSALDADFVMGDDTFVSLLQSGEADAAAARAHQLLVPSIEPGLAKPKTERDTLRLRSRDRIDGDDVVLVFRRGRELRMPLAEWTALAAGNDEPHAIAALRLDHAAVR